MASLHVCGPRYVFITRIWYIIPTFLRYRQCPKHRASLHRRDRSPEKVPLQRGVRINKRHTPKLSDFTHRAS